jgi:FkbH-like protein
MEQEGNVMVAVDEVVQHKKPSVKILVWDLDDTLWHGILAEGDKVRLRSGVVEILKTLDQRGILQSIASKNEHDEAMEKLQSFGLDEYFLYPQINWQPKSKNIEQIAKLINVGLDTVAFVDDQPFEREEVQHCFPEVRVFDVTELPRLSERKDFTPRFITNESAMRRKMYLADVVRNQSEQDFSGPQEEFLAHLDMKFTIASAGEDDLKRAEEMTLRTNQLNTTGYTYSYEELDALRRSDDHLLLICDLEDRFGSYGKIGLTLIEKHATTWVLKLLLMSCRVMSRGVGTLLINHILAQAKQADVRLLSEFRPNERNRMMLITYKFAGFKEIEQRNGVTVLEHDLQHIPPCPAYVELQVLP